MSQTISDYKKQRDNILELLKRLDNFISDGSEFGLSLSEEMENKLSNTISSVKQDSLKIALVGGFSEGKTSIAAAWLGKLDKSTMNISAAESSNVVKVYDIDEDCQLVDTPGLYGYKEKENSYHEIERYKDITKKYVSEAHIILYVMNSKNPIKESHKEDLIWLFKDLNLLPRTVFVLSRFDEVADVEDESDYLHHLHIKRDNIKDRLKEFLNLTSNEVSDLKIVAVSANPFNEGTEYWLENPEEFSKLSHISHLQSATQLIIKNNGGLNEIVKETRKSVFNDIRLREIPKIDQKNTELVKIYSDLEHLSGNTQQQLKILLREIDDSRQSIKSSIKIFFEDVIMQARGLGLETANDFIDREIGEEGVRIQSSINSIFQREIETVNESLEFQISNFNSELNNIESALSKISKQGVNSLIKNAKLNNTAVLSARDSLRGIGKAVGVDLSGVMKFKPYGAIKLANKLNKFIALAGIALEAYDSYKQAKIEEEFRTDINNLIKDLKLYEKELLDLVDSDQFIPKFYSTYLDLREIADELSKQKSYQSEKNQKFENWKRQIDVIDAEFRVISS